MKIWSEIISKFRPHPCPLPQERENCSPALRVAKWLPSSSVSRHESQSGGGRQIDFVKSGDVRWLFPLPEREGQGEGERYN